MHSAIAKLSPLERAYLNEADIMADSARSHPKAGRLAQRPREMRAGHPSTNRKER